MFTTTFINNDGLKIILGHPRFKNKAWVEPKDQNGMEATSVVPFWPIKSFNLVEGATNFQMTWNLLGSWLLEVQSRQISEDLKVICLCKYIRKDKWHHLGVP